MGYEAEVGQGALDSGLHDGSRSRVSEGRPVLSEQVGELLADLPGKRHRRISREGAETPDGSGLCEDYTHLAARSMFLRELTSLRSTCGLPRYSAMAFAGNSVSQT